jgi:8-oxo-dGTP diphosphatase
MDGASVLMVHRTARESDPSFGKYNGLGGKMEPGEDVAACMVREIHEESGIAVTAMELRGTLSWPGFGASGESWLGFVFLVTSWTGTPFTANSEGSLHWVPVAELLARHLPMWEGDHTWLPLLFAPDGRQFHGVLPYDGFEPLTNEWAVSRW